MMNAKNIFKILILLLYVFVCTSGCTALLPMMWWNKYQKNHQAGQDDGLREIVHMTYKPAPDPSEGSLWRPLHSRAYLFEDNKARRVNDILIVQIVESTNASRNATTNVSRKGEMKSSIAKFLGAPLSFGLGNLWGKKTGAATAAERTEQPFDPDIESSSQNSFNGSGSTVRKDTMAATLSARVVDVYPNGNLQIAGNREVTINNEKQIITLSGMVRPDDVSFDNEVLSTAIADARISITGKGAIADKQDPGYGHRLFDFIWPF